MLTWSELLHKRTQSLLYIIACFMIAICARLFFLTIYKQHELELRAQKPHHRLEPIKAPRGCIFDRSGMPLATNRLCYEVGVCYQDFTLFPNVVMQWKQGKRVKVYPKREQIKKLATFLAKELELPTQKVEDFIYSQAALTPSQTTLFKNHLEESLFYRLKVQESFFPGLRVNMTLKRHYPQGALAGQVIGYVGHLNQFELKQQQDLLASLQSQLSIEEDEVSQKIIEEKIAQTRLRLKNCEEIVGKAGIEKSYEAQLRGQDGARTLIPYTRIEEPLVDHEPQAGKSITLAIDSRLQLLAEQLLAENEVIRDAQLTQEGLLAPQNWVKGGSIVVMDPQNGEILALASYPRFNPENFNQERGFKLKTQSIPNHQRSFWLEDQSWIASLWEGRQKLQREIYHKQKDTFSWQNRAVDWKYCLEAICGTKSLIPKHFFKLTTIKRALETAQAFSRIKKSLGDEVDSWSLINFLYSRSSDIPYWPSLSYERSLDMAASRWQEVIQVLPIENDKKILDQAVAELASNFDKMLFVDLCALLIDELSFAQSSPAELDFISLETYRLHMASYFVLIDKVKALASRWHEDNIFSQWRQEHQRSYLKEKRREEKALGNFAKPYLVHLEQQRKQLFEQMWQKSRFEIIQTLVSHSACEPAFAKLLEFIRAKLEEGLDDVLIKESLGHLKIAYELLGERLFVPYLDGMKRFKDLQKPLWASYPLIKKSKAKRCDLALKIYPRYGLGYMNHKAISHLSAPGSIFKLVLAYEVLNQRMQKGLARTWETMSPFKMIDITYRKGSQLIVGKWLSGKEISQMYRGGRIPKSQRSFIGEIDLLGAIESSSNPYFALLADIELSDGPQDLLMAAHQFGWGTRTGIDLPYERAGSLPYDLSSNRTGLFTSAIGQHTMLGTPIQASVMLSAIANGGTVFSPKMIHDDTRAEVRSVIAFPERVREFLLEGMRRVVSGKKGTARSSAVRSFAPGTPERKIINQMVPFMVGKTSTAEFVEVFGISPTKNPFNRSHVWFTGIVFEDPLYQGEAPERVNFKGKKPELVITICLHHGVYGKDSFPLAAILAERWKQLKALDAKKEKKG